MKSVSYLVSWAVLVGGIAGVIYPAFIEGAPGSPPPGLTNILVSFFHPDFTFVYFCRLLCLIVAIGTAYLLIVTHRYSRTPITVVRTVIDAHFNHDGSRATIKRVQTLRANQAGVTAYFCRIAATTRTGLVPENSLRMSAFCHGCDLNDDFLANGSEQSGFQIIHKFGQSMPYNWFMPLIFKGALKKAPDEMMNFIRQRLVIREQEYCYLNEFDGPKRVMTLSANTYPQLNLRVRLHFESGIPATLDVYRIKSNSALPMQKEKNGQTVQMFVERLQNEMVYITW